MLITAVLLKNAPTLIFRVPEGTITLPSSSGPPCVGAYVGEGVGSDTGVDVGLDVGEQSSGSTMSELLLEVKLVVDGRTNSESADPWNASRAILA